MKHYRYYFRILLLMLVGAILVSGCRSRKDIPTQPQPSVEKPDIQREEPQKPLTFHTATANFTCSVNGINANGQLRMQRDSIIWIALNKIIQLGQVVVTQDSVLGYISPYNQYIRMSMKEVKQQYGVDYDMIQRALQGEEVSTNIVKSKTTKMFLGLQFPFAKDINLRINHRLLSGSAVLHVEKVEFNQPLTYPFRIPRSAKPFDPSNY